MIIRDADPLLGQSWQSKSVFNKSSAAAYHYQIIIKSSTPSSLFQVYSTSRIERDTLALQPIALFFPGTGH